MGIFSRKIKTMEEVEEEPKEIEVGLEFDKPTKVFSVFIKRKQGTNF
ncbi:hypothetical protein QNH10_02945 [Sporosarcina thermotolerans]|nr:hypothetical protein [Sporosarcina thermotolerans]WHT48733.1 hypothetical protein QNH10_02945 [Sporosarcina thermotolerans]